MAGTIDAETIAEIERMVQEGKTIVDICNTLGLEWRDVVKFLGSVDKTSWQGAKVMTTNLLNALVKETDPARRKELAAEAKKWIDYLYYDGKRLGQKVDRVRKALD